MTAVSLRFQGMTDSCRLTIDEATAAVEQEDGADLSMDPEAGECCSFIYKEVDWKVE